MGPRSRDASAGVASVRFVDVSSSSTDRTAVPYVMLTQRLELRALTASDGPLLAGLYADPEVSRFIGGEDLTAEAVETQAGRFASVWIAHGYGQSILHDKNSGEFIGRVGLHPWPEWDELELGWVLARPSQGKGLAREAAGAWLRWAEETRPSRYLTAVIHPDNSASIRLAKALGFTFTRSDTTPWSPAVVYRYDLPSPALPRGPLRP
jgi:RimJ/RimL family protein N-acetyltransferase